MTAFLPPNLLAFFAPREPLNFLPPTVKLPHEKDTQGYSGLASFLSHFEDPSQTPAPVKIETKEERNERRKAEKAEKSALAREQGIALWDPQSNSEATADPYKTLFVARISNDTSESKLRREFEEYGPITKVVLPIDSITEKPKGYAFIQFENEKDMHDAYKYGDGKKIDGRRVIVDVERGRTVKGWLPRRLGGGIKDPKPTPKGDDNDRRNNNNGGSNGRYREREYGRNDRRRSDTPPRDRKRARSRDRDDRRGDRYGGSGGGGGGYDRRDRGGDRRDRDRNGGRDRGDRYERRNDYDNYNNGGGARRDRGGRKRSRSRSRSPRDR